jgi:ubiquinone/menaquinone biosynthesis C-methylase UbiE
MQHHRTLNDNFFDSSYKDIWRSLNPEGLSAAESEMIASYLKEGDEVLDLMCGYGRHAIDLARKGFKVTAIDALPSYIDEIKETVRKEDLSLDAVCSNVLKMDLKGEFHLVACMGNSFSFFEKADCEHILGMIARQTRKGSYLLINSWMISEIAIRHFREKDWMEVGELRYLLDYRFEFFPNRIESKQIILHPDGRKEELKGVDYIFSLDEMEAMFRKAGFETESVFSTPRKRPFKLGDTQIYIVARKA